VRRAPLASGSGSPALPAGERWVSTLAAGQRLPEPTRGSFPRLCQIWRVSSGLESWRSCWAWVGKARIKFNRFEKPVFIPCPAVPVFVLSSFIHFIRVSKLKPTSFFMLLKLSSPAWSGHLRDVSEGTNRGETVLFLEPSPLVFLCPLGRCALWFHCPSVEGTSCGSVWVL